MIREMFSDPVDVRSELVVFDLEESFPAECAAIRNSRSIPDAHRLATEIENALMTRMDIPEARRLYIKNWLIALHRSAVSTPGIVNSQKSILNEV